MGFESGGAERDRTVDLLNAIQALSQLSYGPTNLVGNGTNAIKKSKFRCGSRDSTAICMC